MIEAIMIGLMVMMIINVLHQKKHVRVIEESESMSSSSYQTGLLSSHSLANSSSSYQDDFDDVTSLNDPYHTPGLDPVIDEGYHGIDRGMGVANPDTFD